MPERSIEAVIWDFGGVLTSSPFEGFNAYERENALPRDFIRRVIATNPDTNGWALLESNQIDAARFDELFLAESAALGYAIPGAIVAPLLRGTAIRPAMVAALRACKAQFKVGCITNNLPSAPAAPTIGPAGEALALFDVVVESSKVGMRKPDPRIYQLMCEQLDVRPEACVYLDDLGVNCKPAAQMGMIAIKVLGVDQALGALEQATGLTFARDPEAV